MSSKRDNVGCPDDSITSVNWSDLLRPFQPFQCLTVSHKHTLQHKIFLSQLVSLCTSLLQWFIFFLFLCQIKINNWPIGITFCHQVVLLHLPPLSRLDNFFPFASSLSYPHPAHTHLYLHDQCSGYLILVINFTDFFPVLPLLLLLHIHMFSNFLSLNLSEISIPLLLSIQLLLLPQASPWGTLCESFCAQRQLL